MPDTVMGVCSSCDAPIYQGEISKANSATNFAPTDAPNTPSSMAMLSTANAVTIFCSRAHPTPKTPTAVRCAATALMSVSRRRVDPLWRKLPW